MSKRLLAALKLVVWRLTPHSHHHHFWPLGNSQHPPLTEAQRDARYTTAAKIKCQPRLGLSGFRPAGQHFVGSSSLEECCGLPLLLTEVELAGNQAGSLVRAPEGVVKRLEQHGAGSYQQQ
jgi:hypothetical protein